MDRRTFLRQVSIDFVPMEMIIGQRGMNLGGLQRRMFLGDLFNRQPELPPTGDPMDRHAMTTNARAATEYPGGFDNQGINLSWTTWRAGFHNYNIAWNFPALQSEPSTLNLCAL